MWQASANIFDLYTEPFSVSTLLIMMGTVRGCLKKIDKISYSVVTGVISLSGSVKSCDFEQYLVSLGLNSHFLRVPRPKYMMPTHENL